MTHASLHDSECDRVVHRSSGHPLTAYPELPRPQPRSSDTVSFNTDEVPNFSGALAYFFSKPAPPVVAKPVIVKPTTAPKVALAGKRFTVSFKLTRSDTGEPLTAGTMVCDPSVGGKVLKHEEAFVASTARVSFVIPKSAKGKRLKVRVTITLGERSATRVATFRVH